MMLYRLRPPTNVEWIDFPGTNLLAHAVDHNLDLDRLEWASTEDRRFSNDLLRIALAYGQATGAGIVVDVTHTLDLGKSDQLRVLQQSMDEAQAEVRASSGELMERLVPGWTAHGEELDERIREQNERAAKDADAKLAKVLAAPAKPELVEHWRNLGGQDPS